MLSVLVRWLPAFLWMTLIFWGSSDLLAASHTSRIIEPLLRWLFTGISQPRVDEIHFLIRKLGHVTEYAVLACLFYWALRPGNTAAELAPPPRPISRNVFILAWVFAVGYAASDEFHQSFVSSRGASVHDVVIDGCGAAIAMLAIWLLRKLAHSRSIRQQPAIAVR